MDKSIWFYPRIKTAEQGGRYFSWPTSKVVCVGRNYVAHAQELNNPVPEEPLLFIKPNSSLCDLAKGVTLPTAGVCHHEVEIAILISQEAKSINQSQATSYIGGIGLALDLTLRDVQQQLKKMGHPWEKAKSFDGACPISDFIEWRDDINLADLRFNLDINDKILQQGSSADMIFPIASLLSEISRHFTLYPGDVVLTGTPSGVGPLNPGDQLKLELNEHCWHSFVHPQVLNKQ